jgi:hypothetical protein
VQRGVQRFGGRAIGGRGGGVLGHRLQFGIHVIDGVAQARPVGIRDIGHRLGLAQHLGDSAGVLHRHGFLVVAVPVDQRRRLAGRPHDVGQAAVGNLRVQRKRGRHDSR